MRGERYPRASRHGPKRGLSLGKMDSNRPPQAEKRSIWKKVLGTIGALGVGGLRLRLLALLDHISSMTTLIGASAYWWYVLPVFCIVLGIVLFPFAHQQVQKATRNVVVVSSPSPPSLAVTPKPHHTQLLHPSVPAPHYTLGNPVGVVPWVSRVPWRRSPILSDRSAACGTTLETNRMGCGDQEKTGAEHEASCGAQTSRT